MYRHLSKYLTINHYFKNIKMSSSGGDLQKNNITTWGPFLESNILIKDPIHQFKVWFEEICKAKKIALPSAMSLATATKNGTPSVRMMMMRSYGKKGFIFCTDCNSRKGNEIEENPKAAISFFWDLHAKSVRIEGKIEKLNRIYAEDYFYKMPKPNQIGMLCAEQSKIVPGRYLLERNQQEFSKQYKNCEIPVPLGWTCYIVIPEVIEFWQGQHLTDRLHDRIRFRKPKPYEIIDSVNVHPGVDGWVYERLAP